MSFIAFLNEKKVNKEVKQNVPAFSKKLEEFVPVMYNVYVKNDRDIERTITSLLSLEEKGHLGEIIKFNGDHLGLEGNSSANPRETPSKGFRVYVTSLLEYLDEKLAGKEIVFLGNENVPVTDEWKAYYLSSGTAKAEQAGNSKPKTDYHTKDKSLRISHKNFGGSAAFSGNPNEFRATFYTTVLKKLEGDLKENAEKLVDDITTNATRGTFHFNKKRTKSDASNLYDALKKEAELQNTEMFVGDNHEINYDLFDQQNGQYFLKDLAGLGSLSKAELSARNLLLTSLDDDFSQYAKVKSYDESHATLKNILKDFFLKSTDEIRAAFVGEALTGRIKFGDEHPATATHIMYADPITGYSNFKELSEEELIKISKMYTIRMNFKGTRKGEAYSVAHLGTGENDEKKADPKYKGSYTNYRQAIKNFSDNVLTNIDGGKEGNLAVLDKVEESLTFRDYMDMITEEVELKLSTLTLTEGLLDSAVAFQQKIFSMIKEVWRKYVSEMFVGIKDNILEFLNFFELQLVLEQEITPAEFDSKLETYMRNDRD